MSVLFRGLTAGSLALHPLQLMGLRDVLLVPFCGRWLDDGGRDANGEMLSGTMNHSSAGLSGSQSILCTGPHRVASRREVRQTSAHQHDGCSINDSLTEPEEGGFHTDHKIKEKLECVQRTGFSKPLYHRGCFCSAYLID